MTHPHGEDDIKSIGRVLGVLEALNEREVTSIDRLHKATGLPKPTLVRILHTLSGLGYVFHVSRREGYALTEKILRLSAGFRYHDIIVNVARPLLEQFTIQHKWQISIATPDGWGMRVRFNTRHISPFAPDQLFLNRRIGMLESAVGRAYLAFCPLSERSIRLKMTDESRPKAPQTPPYVAELLEGVRTRRYATIEREAANRIRSFAVPVLAAGVEDGAVASLAVFYFASAMTEQQATDRYLEETYRIGGAIAASLAEPP